MKVKITNLEMNEYCRSTWYKIGEVYEVEPYRWNPKKYGEIKGWDGISSNSSKFWIMKCHAEVLNETYELPEDLFEI